MTTPLPVLPQIIVEAGLLPAAPGQGGTTLFLDSATSGKLGTNTLGAATAWTGISPYVLGFTVTRPSTRLQGPLWNYQAGTVSILLDNSDGRFDPDNLAGPYVAGGVTQLAAMVPVRVRAVFASAGYSLYSGFADGWLPAQVTYEAGYAELTLGGTDAFKVLAGITLAATPIEGIGAATGARVKDVLSRAGWYASGDRSVISAGNSTLQGTTLGDTALNLMQVATDSEIGQLYVNGAGAVVFRARRDLLTDARSNMPQAVFGDAPGGPNGVLNANTGFEGGVAPWTASNGAITSSSAQAHSGTKSALLTPTGGGPSAQLVSEQIPVVTGVSYTLSGWVYPTVGWVALSPMTQTFTSSGTWTVPAGVTSIKAECWGAGGGGGGGYTNNAQGGGAGGGAGGYACEPSLAVTSGGTVPYSVGAGGAAGTANTSGGTAGSTGGNSTLTGTSVTVTAYGSAGGGPGSSGIPGGPVGSSTNTIHFSGASGGPEVSSPNGGGGGSSGGVSSDGNFGGAPNNTIGGPGGPAVSGGGGGGNGAAGGTTGYAGQVPGGGGGGGEGFTGIGTNGGAGGGGQVRISYSTAGTLASVSPGINFFDSAGNPQSTATAPALILPTGAWAQFSYTVTAPATGYMTLMPALGGSPPATALTYFDDITVTRASTELPYAAVSRASDDTTIANDIQATRVNGVLQEVQDAASIAKYLFPRSYARSDLILQNDSDALQWAQWVLYVSKSGEDRFESLQVDPQADPANLWPQVLGREIGDRITVVNRPAGVAAPIIKDCFISGITHAWDSVASTWLTTWTLQDATKYGNFLTLDNPVLGKLDANALTY